ncbi:MAG TPA: hypothetical protein VKE88_00415 [Candidatus Nanoarchaeia archaeon]|nr:hypothetical protein [Candidatus Nanoarchaeia archaeon]
MTDRHILGLKYPKFFAYIVAVLVAYFFYQVQATGPMHDIIVNSGYIGAFIAGLFFAYGFTTPLAIAAFLILAPGLNIYAAAVIGGAGALLSDLTMFKFIRKGFSDEIDMLKEEPLIKWVNQKIPKALHSFLIPIIAGFIIASPFPDELAVALLASARHVSTLAFVIYSYLFNTLGILIIYLIGQSI